jgi:hypothetical protein
MISFMPWDVLGVICLRFLPPLYLRRHSASFDITVFTTLSILWHIVLACVPNGSLRRIKTSVTSNVGVLRCTSLRSCAVYAIRATFPLLSFVLSSISPGIFPMSRYLREIEMDSHILPRSSVFTRRVKPVGREYFSRYFGLRLAVSIDNGTSTSE